MSTVQSRIVILLGLAVAVGVFAQVDSGTITGIVSDSTGATVAGVQVKVVQVETNFQFAAVTNPEGIYRVQSLIPGTYQITFEASGFKRIVQGNISLHTGDVLAVNATLEVGNVSESIQVTAQSTLLQTETSSTGTVSLGETLYKMPLFQRSITNSMALVPGLTVQTTGGTAGLSAYTVNGQRNTGTAMFGRRHFGVDPLVSALGGSADPISTPSTKSKFSPELSSLEYGHSSSGVISTVKKSGTNELHGMASDYGRTRRMTHRQFFNLYTAAAPGSGDLPSVCPSWFMRSPI